MKRIYRLVSIALTIIVLAAVHATPVAANNGRPRGLVRLGDSRYVNAEVRATDGRTMLVIETRETEIQVPVVLSGVVFVDGRAVPASLQGDGLRVQTDGGSVHIPLEEFEVVVVDGRLMLKAEVNPLITSALFALGAKLGAKYFPILIGVNSKSATIAGGIAGAGAGGALGVGLDLLLITRLTERP